VPTNRINKIQRFYHPLKPQILFWVTLWVTLFRNGVTHGPITGASRIALAGQSPKEAGLINRNHPAAPVFSIFRPFIFAPAMCVDLDSGLTDLDVISRKRPFAVKF
jgi:hypothetical protein